MSIFAPWCKLPLRSTPTKAAAVGNGALAHSREIQLRKNIDCPFHNSNVMIITSESEIDERDFGSSFDDVVDESEDEFFVYCGGGTVWNVVNAEVWNVFVSTVQSSLDCTSVGGSDGGDVRAGFVEVLGIVFVVVLFSFVLVFCQERMRLEAVATNFHIFTVVCSLVGCRIGSDQTCKIGDVGEGGNLDWKLEG
jgi:hypothetical protein